MRARIGCRIQAPYASVMKCFADNIRVLVNEAGDQTLFAESVGTSQSAVSRWIAGKVPRNIATLNRVAHVARVSVDQLLEVPLHVARARELTADAGAILMMPVSFPSEDMLTDMFAGILELVDRPDLVDELASRLAQRLPNALAQAQAAHIARGKGQTELRDGGVPLRSKSPRNPRPRPNI